MSKKPKRRHAPARRTPAHDHATRNRTIVAVTALGAVAAGIGAAIGMGLFDRFFAGDAEHAAPDLAADAPTPGTNRAPDAFRPDPTAPVPASEREALRPATGPSPTLVADRGELAGMTAPANS
jgi:hypothetical protein